MPRAEKSVEITAPPRKIWPFIVEVDKIVQWETVTRFEFTGERIDELGTTFYIVDQAADELEKICCVVTECVQDEKFAFAYTQKDIRDELTYNIESTEMGSRVKIIFSRSLTWTVIGKIVGVLYDAFGWSLKKPLEEAMEKRLANLKRLVEARF